MWALPCLPNGKAGWPAELLCYAAYHVQSDSGACVKVWALAPLLTAMLNDFFQSGTIPAYVTSALVTPIHKKGNDLDNANYRPIAIGEPLYRMSTIYIISALLIGKRRAVFAALLRLASAQSF